MEALSTSIRYIAACARFHGVPPFFRISFILSPDRYLVNLDGGFHMA